MNITLSCRRHLPVAGLFILAPLFLSVTSLSAQVFRWYKAFGLHGMSSEYRTYWNLQHNQDGVLAMWSSYDSNYVHYPNVEQRDKNGEVVWDRALPHFGATDRNGYPYQLNRLLSAKDGTGGSWVWTVYYNSGPVMTPYVSFRYRMSKSGMILSTDTLYHEVDHVYPDGSASYTILPNSTYYPPTGSVGVIWYRDGRIDSASIELSELEGMMTGMPMYQAHDVTSEVASFLLNDPITNESLVLFLPRLEDPELATRQFFHFPNSFGGDIDLLSDGRILLSATRFEWNPQVTYGAELIWINPYSGSIEQKLMEQSVRIMGELADGNLLANASTVLRVLSPEGKLLNIASTYTLSMVRYFAVGDAELYLTFDRGAIGCIDIPTTPSSTSSVAEDLLQGWKIDLR